MNQITATELNKKAGDCIDRCLREPVFITRSGTPKAVLLSIEDYHSLENLKLKQLQFEINKGEQDIQSGKISVWDKNSLKKKLEDQIESQKNL